MPDDKFYFMGDEYSRQEVAELEEFKGGSLLIGDIIRLHDALVEFWRVFTKPLRDLVSRLG